MKLILSFFVSGAAFIAFVLLLLLSPAQGVMLAFDTFQYVISLKLLLLGAFMLGMINVGAFLAGILRKNKETLSAYQRQVERKSIDSTESSSRVQVLEAKIEVLEKALQDALNK